MVATTRRGAELTEEHRLQQVLLGERLAKALRPLFRRHVRYDDIDASTLDFVRAAGPILLRFREASRMTSFDYVDSFRRVEAPDTEPPVLDDDGATTGALLSSLGSTVRGVLKALSKKGYSAEEAMDRAEVSAVGKATKIVADGGREVIEAEVRRGNGPVGYARVVDADPCPFCAMLASRGVYYMGDERPVGLYHTNSFRSANARFVGDGAFKVHDHCQCTLEPVYQRDGKITLPGNGNKLAEEWAAIASGRRDAWHAWQRWRESGTLPEDYDGPLEGTRRVSAPVRGQATGSKKRPVPAKASERKAKVESKAPATAEDLRGYADGLEGRANAILEDIAALNEVGQDDSEITVRSLRMQRERLLSRIGKYRRAADRM